MKLDIKSRYFNLLEGSSYRFKEIRTGYESLNYCEFICFKDGRMLINKKYNWTNIL